MNKHPFPFSIGQNVVLLLLHSFYLSSLTCRLQWQNLLGNIQSHEQFGIPTFPMLWTIKVFLFCSLVCLFRLIFLFASLSVTCYFTVSVVFEGHVISAYARTLCAGTRIEHFSVCIQFTGLVAIRVQYNELYIFTAFSVHFRLWHFRRSWQFFQWTSFASVLISYNYCTLSILEQEDKYKANGFWWDTLNRFLARRDKPFENRLFLWVPTVCSSDLSGEKIFKVRFLDAIAINQTI